MLPKLTSSQHLPRAGRGGPGHRCARQGRACAGRVLSSRASGLLPHVGLGDSGADFLAPSGCEALFGHQQHSGHGLPAHCPPREHTHHLPGSNSHVQGSSPSSTLSGLLCVAGRCPHLATPACSSDNPPAPRCGAGPWALPTSPPSAGSAGGEGPSLGSQMRLVLRPRDGGR